MRHYLYAAAALLIEALSAVALRHKEGQPANVPEEVVQEVTKDSNWFGGVMTAVGAFGAAVEWIRSQDLTGIAVFGGIALCGVLILTFLGPKMAQSIKKIKEALS